MPGSPSPTTRRKTRRGRTSLGHSPSRAWDDESRHDEPTSAAGAPSYIGATMVLRGDLSLQEDLIIDGRFDGRIRQDHHRLSIGERATVTAEIHTGSAIIAGTVAGDVYGSSTVLVKRTARLHGALSAKRLCFEAGANLEDVILSGNIVRIETSD